MLEHGDTYDLSTEAEQRDCAIKQITTFSVVSLLLKCFLKVFNIKDLFSFNKQ